MEWSVEQSQFVESLEGEVSFILPEAPDNMKAIARKINSEEMKVRGYNTYVGLNFQKNNMYQLRIPLSILKEGESFIIVEMPSLEGTIRHRLPKFGIVCLNKKVIAIESSIREECLVFNQKRTSRKHFLSSSLDVTEKYKEHNDDR